MNLIEFSEFIHPQTFEIINNKIFKKESYTLQDLWGFINLCDEGVNSSLRNRTGVTRSELNEAKQAVLNSLPPIPSNLQAFLLSRVQSQGLDVVLYGLEEFFKVKELSELENNLDLFLKRAEVFIARSNRNND